MARRRSRDRDENRPKRRPRLKHRVQKEDEYEIVGGVRYRKPSYQIPVAENILFWAAIVVVTFLACLFAFNTEIGRKVCTGFGLMVAVPSWFWILFIAIRYEEYRAITPLYMIVHTIIHFDRYGRAFVVHHIGLFFLIYGLVKQNSS